MVVTVSIAVTALGTGVIVRNPELFNLTGVGSPLGMAVVLAGLALGLLCLRFPDVALCCLVAFVYLNVSDVLVRSHGLPSMLQLAFVPLALAGWSASHGRRPRLLGLSLLLGSYVVVVLCSTTVAADTAAADERLFEHLRGLAIFAVVALLARSAHAIH